MAFDASQWMTPTGSGYTIDNSLRFDSASSAKLTNTFASAGNRRTFTFSTWVKRSTVSGYNVLFGIEEAADGSAENLLFFDTTSGNIRFGWNDYTRSSAAFFRDVSGWYHVLLAVDTTDATAQDRIKMYVNGVQITVWASSSNNHPDENEQFLINKASEHHIGIFPRVSAYANVYMAETHFIDGAAKTPADFGESGDYGEFKPIEYAGSYGDEGFYLDFKSSGVGTASSSTVGADRSGNTNHWTSTNLAATDQMLDSPTNNFATMNPLFRGAPLTGDVDSAHTLTEGNLKMRASANKMLSTTIIPTSGKCYAEFYVNAQSTYGPSFGWVNNEYAQADLSTNTGLWRLYSRGAGDQLILYPEGGTSVTIESSALDNGDIIQFAWDCDSGKAWIGRNNTWYNSSLGTDGDPAAGSNPTITTSVVKITNNFAPFIASADDNSTVTLNFGQDSSFAGAATAQGNTDSNDIGDFYYAPPSGFLAVCNSNLPEPAIVPTDYFKTVLWTGNGSDGKDIAVGFQPDWVMIKNRSSTDAAQTFDSIRGVTKVLDASAVTSETVNDDTLTHFISTGFTLGDDVAVNTNNENYVAWCWKAGTAVSGNTSGSGTAVSYSGTVNTDSGFSIIKYNGNGVSGHTIPHHLGVAPEIVIVKNLTSHAWEIYHPRSADSGIQYSNDWSGAENFGVWASTHPTTSVVTVSAGNGVNRIPANNGDVGYVMYSFASKTGFSKMGTHKANGNVDGPLLITGFTPSFISLKITGLDGENWHEVDIERDPFNPVTKDLAHNHSGKAETTNEIIVDFLSNGFKLRCEGGPTYINQAGYSAIWMAYAIRPEKYTNAQ